MAGKAKRIAAIDIGTNSIHMIVAEAKSRGYRVVDREKEMVQLGLSSLDGQPLTEDALDRGVSTITRMAEIARRWEADEIIAVATSAVREAPNRRDFLKRVRDYAGIKVRVISGEEEADYIFRAVRSAVDIGSSTVLCIDIGGGSAEMIVGTASEIYFTASEPLGSLRLSQRFELADRPAGGSVERCRDWVMARTSKIRKRIRRIGFDQAIGTSGTILTLANICCEREPANGLLTLERTRLEAMLPTLAAMTAEERKAKFGIDEKRATTIVGGAIALQTIMSSLGVESLLACPVAIREGIIESRIAKSRTEAMVGGSVRRKSVMHLAERTDCDMRHGVHVARLATRIFDQTSKLHRLNGDTRELLEYAALLHESGSHISDRGHHKHTYYLIRHADLRGFTDQQLLIIANVARYYRKAAPDLEDPNFAELSEEQQEIVSRLAAILRVAEGLDRGHRQRVRDVAISNGAKTVRFVARTRADASVELESAEKRAKYFSKVFETRVKFEVI